jgi:hypothetical protein
MEEGGIIAIVLLAMAVLILFLLVVVPRSSDGFYVTQTPGGRVYIRTSVEEALDASCEVDISVEEAHALVRQLNASILDARK